jgi:hypothetical protein
MASGRPDFHPTMLLEGKYGSTLIPVLVDALGQLYTIMTGNAGGIPLPVLLDAAGRILAHLVGSDGGTIRDVAVDASGKLIIQIQGSDGGTLRTVAVDASGYILSVMKGDFGGTLKTIAVDTNGIMKANISVQDLNYLKFRPVYGAMDEVIESGVICSTGVRTAVATITGKGAILGGSYGLDGGVSPILQSYGLTVDGTAQGLITAVTLDFNNVVMPDRYPIYLLNYEPVSDYYRIGVMRGITFETSISFDVLQITGSNKAASAIIHYALVP